MIYEASKIFDQRVELIAKMLDPMAWSAEEMWMTVRNPTIERAKRRTNALALAADIVRTHDKKMFELGFALMPTTEDHIEQMQTVERKL